MESAPATSEVGGSPPPVDTVLGIASWRVALLRRNASIFLERHCGAEWPGMADIGGRQLVEIGRQDVGLGCRSQRLGQSDCLPKKADQPALLVNVGHRH